VVNDTTRPLYPLERLGAHCIGGMVGPRAGLDWCRKSRFHRDSIPGPSRPWRVAIPTELSRPTNVLNMLYKTRCSHTLSWNSLRNGSHVVVQGFISYTRIFISSLSGFSTVFTPMLSSYRYVSGTCYGIYFLNSIAPIYRLPVEFMKPLKMCLLYFLLLLCFTALFCGVC
jgi:hypothetical protein